MSKSLTVLGLFIIAIIIAGLYGILHDQLTYTISPEYYTKFQFYQFELQEEGYEKTFEHPRQEVSIVGFLATWWMGIPVGLILNLVGLIHSDRNKMFYVTLKSFLITIAIAFLTGLVGLAYGQFVLANRPKTDFTGWYFPANLIDFKNFVKVGSMHNFSYLGGLTGLIAGIIYSVRQKLNVNKPKFDRLHAT